MMNREETMTMMGYPTHYPIANNSLEGENRCRVRIPSPSNDVGGYGMAPHSPTNSDGCDGKGKKKEGLRKGKWTGEEEKYTNKVIEVFNAGLLKLGDHEKGITLRAYLAEKLECDPMRITKKYTGASCLGKRVYHYDSTNVNAEEADKAKIELEELEKGFREKLEQMNRKRFCDVGSSIENSKMISTPAIDALLQSNKVMQASNSGGAGNHLRMANAAISMKNMYPAHGMMPNHSAMYPPHSAYMPYPGAMYVNPNDPQQYMRSSPNDGYYANYQYYMPPPPPAAMMHLFHAAATAASAPGAAPQGTYPFPTGMPSVSPSLVSDAANMSNHPSADDGDDLPDVFDDEEVLPIEVEEEGQEVAGGTVAVEELSIELVVPKVQEEVKAQSPKASSIAAPVMTSVSIKEEIEETPITVQQQHQAPPPVQEELQVPEPPKVVLNHKKHSLFSSSGAEESSHSVYHDAYRMMPPMKKPRASSYGNLSAYIPTVSSSSMLSADQNIDPHSLIGIFTHLHKISSKEDLSDFFFENTPSASMNMNSVIPMMKASPISMLHKTASNKMLSKVDSVESLCKLISPHFYTSNF